MEFKPTEIPKLHIQKKNPVNKQKEISKNQK